ncbi:hypothetical protein NDU88_005166 [Pleurodeles waltl]|uniref:Uncharacterized protein n=1 Tax=Pleurodeles waltl TaxID=8319 RepID=A0AAV7RHR1_PLEWA|nr:hypothetical protein NDU88_005166 [Pleurodeles waltl]
MGRNRRTDASQGKTMEQYTTPVPPPQRHTRLGGSEDSQSVATTTVEPSGAEIFAAIQDSRVALEGKIETVAVEVNLLRADWWMMESSIVELQMEVGALRKQMQPEKVWIWLEMWDKATPGSLVRTGGVAHRASGVDGPDWRTHGGSLLEGTVARGSAVDPALRIETQQDGTVAVVLDGLADGSGG